MIVCIAEKPSVARDIARILGATAQRDGYMEGNGYQVTWTFGHLCELKEPNDYLPNWRYWTLAALPMVPQRFGLKLIPDNGYQKQFRTIEKLYAGADEIINCGDAGQEGELIQRWVMQMAKAKCPVKRLWISSMTDEAIREGFANLKEQSQYESLYLAGLCRAVGDWLLGMNCTRLYTLMYRQQRGQVLSIGRVQTPTLALIVQRQKEIDNFKPEPYWVLSTIYRDTLFTATSGKFLSEEEGEKAFALIDGQPFVISDVKKKQGKEPPKQLYDLTSLQVDLNRKYGFSSQMSLNIIQGLYEKKLTTYPRVDTQYLTDDIYPKCPGILNGVSQCVVQGQKPYLAIIQNLAAMGKTLPKSKRVFDNSKVTDHHAIIPTGVVPTGLDDAERKVYDLVARRFVAAFYPDCVFSTTTVSATAGEVDFKASGKEILSPGWRQVYSGKELVADDTKADTEEKVLPTFVKGETGPHKPTLTRKMTIPPKHYTEASLLRAMETAGKLVDDEELSSAMKENGIGRPSSRAGIIETLFKRNYIRRERKNLVATPTGIQLIDTIHDKLLTSVELTGMWEKKLRDIEHHKYDAVQFIGELKEQVSRIVTDVLRDVSGRSIESGAAPAKDADTKKAAADTKKAAAGTKKAAAGTKKPKDGEAKKRSPRKASVKQQVEDSRQQAPQAAAGGQTGVQAGDVCPACGQGRIIRGNTAYGCSRWKEGCAFRAPLEQA